MKSALVLAALLMPLSAMAQTLPSQDQQDQCMKIGLAYRMAATGRDSNWPPTLALKTITSSSVSGITQEQGKRIVNQVYFDPAFVNAGGQVLANQIYTACLHPNGRYQPLK